MSKEQELQTNVARAAKWSTITEFALKLVLPVTNMVLARLLTPAAFGIVATVMIVVSFADIFTDAGFQKYLVQHEFCDEKDREESSNTAFWTNLVFSLFVWLIIAVFRDNIASLVGSGGYGHVIAVSGVLVVLISVSGILSALLRRDFDFKTLFYVRIAGAFVPFVVTIPLAFFTKSFWALIVGNIVTNAITLVLLICRGNFKPKLSFKLSKLREMFSFSVWTMFEAVSIWMTSYIGTFIVGRTLSEHHTGVYKTSVSTVNSYMSLITASTTPVLFSALSRLQNDNESFEKTYLDFQRIVALFVLPMGAGIYLYRELVTSILLGEQWADAAHFIGLWGLTSAFTIVYSNYNSEVFRSKGKPKLSLLVQILHLVVLVPALVVASEYGFETLYVTRSLVRFQMIAVSLVVLRACFGIRISKIIVNTAPLLCATAVMSIVSVVINGIFNGIAWQFVCIVICIVVYFAMVMLFPKPRKEIFGLINKYALRRQR